MGKQRYVDTKLWSDSYVSKLDPVEKLLFIYLMTNERTNLSGIYELPIKYMSVETGIETSMLQNILTRFENDGKIVMFEGWVRLVNAIKHQNMNNAKIKTGVEKLLDDLPITVREGLKLDLDESSMSHTYPIHDQSHIIELNRIESNKIESNIGTSSEAPKKAEKPVDEVAKSYYDTIKLLELPVRNHVNLRSRIKALEKDIGTEKALTYLAFVRDYYPNLKDNGYKPRLTEGLDIYAKRLNLQAWIERQMIEQNKPAPTAGGRPLF